MTHTENEAYKMFSKFKDKLMGGAKRLSGRTDLLEAVCSSAALVASADGSVDDSEIEATITAVTANETLNTAFSPREIEGAIQRQLDRAKGGRVGRNGLYKEIEDVASSEADAEIVMLTALDIAEADGEVSAEETQVLERIAKSLGVKLADFE